MKNLFNRFSERTRGPLTKASPKILLAVIICAVFLLRLPLTSRGHFYFADEQRYRHVFTFLDKLKEGEVKESISYLFRSYCRPAFMAISVIPAIGQRMIFQDTGKTAHVENETPRGYKSYDLASLFINVISLTLLCLYFHKIALLLSCGEKSAIAGTFLFSCLNSNFMYVRHMVPYYLGMLFYLVSLYSMLKNERSSVFKPSAVVNCSLLAALAFCAYPGYFQFIFILLALAVLSPTKRIKKTAIFVSVFASVLIMVEIISQIGGISNIFAPYQLKAVYNESGDPPFISISHFTAAFKYMGGTEGILGVVLLAVFIIYSLFYLPRREKNRDLKIILLTSITLYFASSLFSCFFKVIHKNIYAFYFYTVIISLGATAAAGRMTRMKNTAIFSLCFIALASFIHFYTLYSRTYYPLDIRFKMSADFPAAKTMYTAEFYNKTLQKIALYTAIKDKYDFLAVNASPKVYSFGPQGAAINMPDGRIVISHPYPDVYFPPYGTGAIDCLFKKQPAQTMRVYRIK